jgi:hypothetical protein
MASNSALPLSTIKSWERLKMWIEAGAVCCKSNILDAIGVADAGIDFPAGAGKPIYPQEAKEALL